MLQHAADILSSWDRALFYTINRGMENGAFDLVMPFLTSFGNFKLLLAGTVLFMLFYNGKTRTVALAAGVAVLFSDQLGNVIKHLVERPRPCNVLPDVHLLVGCSGSFAFPSNHSANVFAVSTVLSWKYRKAALLFFVTAAAVAFSRVYVGVHYPLDVTGGAALGLLCGAAALLLYRRYAPRVEHLLERFTWKRRNDLGT